MKSFFSKVGQFIKQNCLLLALILTAVSVTIVGLCITDNIRHPVSAVAEVIRDGKGSDEPGDTDCPDTTAAVDTTTAEPPVTDVTTADESTADTSAKDTTAETKDDPRPVEGDEYFSDALFIGDSRTHGLYLYGKISGASYFAKTSMSVFNCLKTTGVQTGQAADVDLHTYLSGRQFGKIYLLLGINEIGSDTSAIASQYAAIIAKLREWQPNAIIIIQSNTNVTAKKSAENKKTFNNDRLNDLNRKLAALSDNERIFYLDIAHLFNDDTGAMKPEYTGDGVHLKGKYYGIWRDYLLESGKF